MSLIEQNSLWDKMSVKPHMRKKQRALRFVRTALSSLGLLATMQLGGLQPLWGKELTFVVAMVTGLALVFEQLDDKNTGGLLRGSPPATCWLKGLGSGLLLSLILVPQLLFPSGTLPAGPPGCLLWSNSNWRPIIFLLFYQYVLFWVLWNAWNSCGSLRHVFFAGIYPVVSSGIAVLLSLSPAGRAYREQLSPIVEAGARSTTQVAPVILSLPFVSMLNWLLCLRHLYLLKQLLDERQQNQVLRTNVDKLTHSNVHVLERALLHSVEIRQAERLEVAQEIHDVLGFTLSAGLIGNEVLLEELLNEPQIHPAVQEKLSKQFNEQQERMREAIQQVRMAASRLRRGRARFARDWELLLSIFGETTRIAVRRSIPASLNHLKNPAIGKLIYRIIQESLTNALRHGQATMVDVSMLRGNNCILLRISDNGRGNCQSLQMGNGLHGMMERLQLVNGRLAWQTEPNKGFDLGIEIPYLPGDFFTESLPEAE